MTAVELRTPREKTLYRIAAVIAGLCWAALVLSLVGAIYGLIIGGLVAVAHVLFLAHVRGNGVRVGPRQLPHVWAKVERAAAVLGLPEPPPTYVLQAGGVLNAYATKLFGRRFVILNAEIVEACVRHPQGAGVDELDFVIGHELGHLAAGHLSWFLLPARIVPLLGAAYSRACEYTCDRCGHEVVGDATIATAALTILAAGGRLGRQVDVEAFIAQREESGGFWMAVHELNASHPYLCKRVAALREYVAPGSAVHRGRSPLAYPLAPMFAFASSGGSSGALVVVAMMGVMAAIAVPAFKKYIERSKAAAERAAQSQELAPAAMSDSVSGQGFPWRMRLPGATWRLLPDAQARANNPLADRWITRPDLDAHVFVIGEALNGQALSIDAYERAVLANLAKQADFKLLERKLVGEQRRLVARATMNGMALTYLFRLQITSGTAFQVVGLAPTSAIPNVRAELDAALDSFDVR